ncbi:MAG: hypothetical protein JO015_19010 [Verrucomicrobia bacterium]|nr:hypothetical protein [Verrucomicrobiota bacterium]
MKKTILILIVAVSAIHPSLAPFTASSKPGAEAGAWHPRVESTTLAWAVPLPRKATATLAWAVPLPRKATATLAWAVPLPRKATATLA